MGASDRPRGWRGHKLLIVILAAVAGVLAGAGLMIAGYVAAGEALAAAAIWVLIIAAVVSAYRALRWRVRR